VPSSIQLIEFNLEIACGAVQMEFGNVAWGEYSKSWLWRSWLWITANL